MVKTSTKMMTHTQTKFVLKYQLRSSMKKKKMKKVQLSKETAIILFTTTKSKIILALEPLEKFTLLKI